MKKSLLILSFLGLLSTATDAWCNDDVVVDLSVLGEVSSPVMSSVKPAPKLAKKKGASVAAIPVSMVALEKKAESSLVDLPNTEPKFPVVKAKPLIKPETLKNVIVELKPSEQDNTDKIFEGRLKDVKTPEIVSKQEETELVKIETLKKEEAAQPVKFVETNAYQAIEAKVEANSVVEMQKIEEPVMAEKLETDVVLQNVEKNIQANIAVSVETSPVEPIKPMKMLEVKKLLSNHIYFGEEEAELTDEQKSKISQIMLSFKNKKIRLTIFSYTLNSDEDVHKRRLKSVTRAGEVRKYLISLGYKNSGMKIVNVDEDSGKVNTVEIVEVK